MTCNCGGCIDRQLLCIGKGNSKTFVFSVLDQDGDEVDISSDSEIVFLVSEGVSVAGNILPGGSVLIEKRLSDGDVLIAGTGYQFVVNLSPSDTADIMKVDNYYDATLHTSSGDVYTVKAGKFRVTPTSAGN